MDQKTEPENPFSLVLDNFDIDGNLIREGQPPAPVTTYCPACGQRLPKRDLVKGKKLVRSHLKPVE